MSTNNLVQSDELSTSLNNLKECHTKSESNLSTNRSTSLDSLANSSHNSDSSSETSQDHDSDSGTESHSKNLFIVKCEVHEHSDKDSLSSWTRSIESLRDQNSELSYEYVSNENSVKHNADKRIDLNKARMETIPEENSEPKVSVKEILARFENLRDKKEADKEVKIRKKNCAFTILKTCMHKK